MQRGIILVLIHISIHDNDCNTPVDVSFLQWNHPIGDFGIRFIVSTTSTTWSVALDHQSGDILLDQLLRAKSVKKSTVEMAWKKPMVGKQIKVGKQNAGLSFNNIIDLYLPKGFPIKVTINHLIYPSPVRRIYLVFRCQEKLIHDFSSLNLRWPDPLHGFLCQFDVSWCSEISTYSGRVSGVWFVGESPKRGPPWFLKYMYIYSTRTNKLI